MNKILRFLLAGVPAFIVALGLNYLLVKQLHLPKSSAYAVVLTVQIVINFFACRYFVFDLHPEHHWRRAFVIFFNGIILFRLADWGLYVLLTHLKFPFLAAQVLNVALFGLLKFEFARRVFEQKPAVASSVLSPSSVFKRNTVLRTQPLQFAILARRLAGRTPSATMPDKPVTK
jgi:putative flippase GtrA